MDELTQQAPLDGTPDEYPPLESEMNGDQQDEQVMAAWFKQNGLWLTQSIDHYV